MDNRQIIMNAFKNPQFFCDSLPMGLSNRVVINSKCSDQIIIGIQVVNQCVKIIAYSGQGCIISFAAIEILSRILIHQPLEKALKITKNFIAFLNRNDCVNESILGDLLVFTNLHNQPTRLNCALAPVEELQKLLETNHEF